jgi:hypothetical protein
VAGAPALPEGELPDAVVMDGAADPAAVRGAIDPARPEVECVSDGDPCPVGAGLAPEPDREREDEPPRPPPSGFEPPGRMLVPIEVEPIVLGAMPLPWPGFVEGDVPFAPAGAPGVCEVDGAVGEALTAPEGVFVAGVVGPACGDDAAAGAEGWPGLAPAGLAGLLDGAGGGDELACASGRGRKPSGEAIWTEPPSVSFSAPGPPVEPESRLAPDPPRVAAAAPPPPCPLAGPGRLRTLAVSRLVSCRKGGLAGAVRPAARPSLAPVDADAEPPAGRPARCVAAGASWTPRAALTGRPA